MIQLSAIFKIFDYVLFYFSGKLIDMYSAVKHDSVPELIKSEVKSEDESEDVLVPELVKSEIKSEVKSEVKNEVKLEEDNSFPDLVKTEIKKEEKDLIFTKRFVCTTCSVQCDNEDLFVKHVQQHHVTNMPSSSRDRTQDSNLSFDKL